VIFATSGKKTDRFQSAPKNCTPNRRPYLLRRPSSAGGTSRKCRHCPRMSAIGGKPHNICSMRGFRILTHFGRRAVDRSLNPMPNIRLIRRQRMLLHCRGRGETGNEDGLAGRGRGDHVDAGACGRHGGDDLAVSARARPINRQDRPATHRDRRTAGKGDGRFRHHGSQRGRIIHRTDIRRAGHNANLLQSKADIVGVAVAHNEQTRYKTYWAMVIAEKPSKKKEPKVAAERKTAERQENAGSSENPISTIKNFVCKYLC
jgi:hypothetical protein